MFYFSYLDPKYPLSANRTHRIKVVSLSQTFVTRLFPTSRIQWKQKPKKQKTQIIKYKKLLSDVYIFCFQSQMFFSVFFVVIVLFRLFFLFCLCFFFFFFFFYSWEHFVGKKVVSLHWNSVARIIWICRAPLWCFFLLFKQNRGTICINFIQKTPQNSSWNLVLRLVQ